jgi:hypothetical protein
MQRRTWLRNYTPGLFFNRLLDRVFLQNLFAQISIHSLLCINNEKFNSLTPSSFFTGRVSYVDEYVIKHISKGLTKVSPFLLVRGKSNC